MKFIGYFKQMNCKDKEKVRHFFKNLTPRPYEPRHSDIWSQTWDFLYNNFPDYIRCTTELIELFENGELMNLLN